MKISNLWPKKKWKKRVFVFLIIFFSAGISVLGYVSWVINTDVKSEIDIINNEGISNALLIYHPGITSFTKDVSYSFAEGLEENNWRIEITPPSNEAPTNPSEYDLIIFCAPIYGFGPSPTISRHIDRITDFQSTRIVIILTGAGSPGDSLRALKEIIEQKNGFIESETVLFSLAPNEEDKSGNDLSKELGRKILP